jgi:hypothetical protein
MMSALRNGSRAWTARVAASLGLFAIVTTAAFAEDVPASRAGTNAATAVATGAVPVRAADAAPPAGVAQSSTAASETAPRKVICVNAVQCFSVKSTDAPLDLRAPDIRRVFSEAQLQHTLPDPEDAVYEQETVQVEGERQLAPVSIGIMAIPWAILHPTQAWRIFMPLPSAK